MASQNTKNRLKNLMKIFDFYILRNLGIATFFIAIVLTFIVFLTQSLRFLEIVINSASGGSAFWVLTGLALPRFFEVILPLSLMSATLFLYNKLTADSELIAMKGIGHSPFALARPALLLGLMVTFLLWGITMWIAPMSLAKMHEMRTALKAEFSTLLFREGVNAPGKGITVYIRERTSDGELHGLMIHDSRDKSKLPTTIMAKRGILVEGQNGHQIIVFDGRRHEFDRERGVLQKLGFDRYTIDLPENKISGQRWSEPNERTINQLLNPDRSDTRDVQNLHDFTIEIHRRVTGPLLALTFPLVALSLLLLGPVDRRGLGQRIAYAIVLIMLLQGLFLASYNMARNNIFGLVLMYIVVLAPAGISLFALSGFSEKMRREFLYRKKQEAA